MSTEEKKDTDVEHQPQEEGVVIIVDPYSTGCMIAQEMTKRGYRILCLWTSDFSDEMKTHVPVSCAGLPSTYYAELQEGSGATLDETAQRVRDAALPHTIVACVAGGEAGVDVADALSEKLGVVTNGTTIANRRDKKVQQELIKEAGLRSVRQAGGETLKEVEDFLRTEEYPVVLKPVDSAGSDGVKLCHTYTEASNHFHHLLATEPVNGGQNTVVLCQEFLQGKEYVIDHVSCAGVHKTMMVWVYDKRPTNGSAFVYYGMVPIDPESAEAKVLIPYVQKVLDALGIQNGPSHGEVIITKDGPCLVEMNCRAHGGDGNWAPLARALTGGVYSQIEATADAYLDPKRFEALPVKPPSPLQASGLEVNLVSFSQGTVKSMPGFDVIQKLPSFIQLSPAVGVGSKVDYTIDLISSPGCCILMNKDASVLEKDLNFIRYLEEINGLFVYETRLENIKRPEVDSICLDTVSELKSATPKKRHQRVFSSDGPSLVRIMSNDRPMLGGPLVKRMTTVDANNEVVVVVDPYSTGCHVVKEILNRTFRVIALWTKGFSTEMRSHVPINCDHISYHAQVEEGDTLADTVAAIYKASGSFRVVACLAGGEAGVDLTDRLSERLDVRSNGTQVANRRNKQVQQEIVGSAGLRSVRQAGGSQFAQVESFLQSDPYPVVLKPVDSAGSDGVKLCHSFEEAKEHFDLLSKDFRMVNGPTCSEVLCQEFLRGREYVVDTVSREGVHKATMVWVYDKRPCNGAAFVYFGCVPVDADSPEATLLIPYVRRVLDALGIKNGPSHAEVIMTPSGPCLVEMNCRAHGGDGNWAPLARALTGYSQVETTVDAYLDKKQFSLLPDRPPSPFKASGQEVILVSYSRGTVKSTPGFDAIKELQSFVYLETGVKKGSKVDYTVDLFTGIGSVILVHPDKEVLENDVARIRQMEKDNALFEYEDVGFIMRAASSVALADMKGSCVTEQFYASQLVDDLL